MNRLQTIDADTLQSTAYEPVSFVVDDLLPQGLHLLAGAPKIGKSWLALWLCLCAAQGKPLWTFATRPCEVLYLCLEDSFQRIQSRLFDLTEDAPPTLHFAVMSQQLHNGLVEQIEQFLKEHPQTRLIVIDTLQRIRTAGNDANQYASDYRDIGVLKALADKHRIAILLVHHLRKMNDDDPMNMISGTTGLSGATDSNFVLRKSQRREDTATLYCTGRDIPYAADRDAFVSLMESEGYTVRWEDTRKYITYTTPDGMRCRDNKLHEEKYCKEAMEHEFRIRAKLVQRKFHRAAEIDGGIEADEPVEQRIGKYTAADDAAHRDPVRSAADNEQADGAGRRNKLGAGGNPEDPAGTEAVHRSDAGAEHTGRDTEIADRDEQPAGTDWEPEREIFLQMDSVAAGLQPAGGPQVDRAAFGDRRSGDGRVVWRGGDSRPVPLIPAAAGLAAAGTLMGEDEDAEEKRRRMEAKIAAENFGAVVGFAAGAAMAVKEKLDEHAAREEQQHEQTMGGF